MLNWSRKDALYYNWSILLRSGWISFLYRRNAMNCPPFCCFVDASSSAFTWLGYKHSHLTIILWKIAEVMKKCTQKLLAMPLNEISRSFVILWLTFWLSLTKYQTESNLRSKKLTKDVRYPSCCSVPRSPSFSKSNLHLPVLHTRKNYKHWQITLFEFISTIKGHTNSVK